MECSDSTDTRVSRLNPKRRSRFGCRNCKLRKIKCDESKPRCKKCTAFGVVCNNYKANVPDLQPIVDDSSAKADLLLRPPPTGAVWTWDRSAYYQLDAKCQELVTRYLGSNLITPDKPELALANRNLLKQAFIHPFLMHASIAIALAYDRYLQSPPGGVGGSRRSVEECYHWSRSTILFNQRLREPIETADKDAIWGTAAALTVLIFSSPDALTPEESWPLKQGRVGEGKEKEEEKEEEDGGMDLQWLRMSRGKMSLWSIANPLRPDSLFRVMAPLFTLMSQPLPDRGREGIPDDLASLCGLDRSSTAEENPYLKAAHAVSRTLGIPDSQMTTGQTEIFTRCIKGRFKSLLQRRDPVALLLMYMWYRKMGPNLWWVELRARVEMPSIYSYLQMYHGGDEAVMHALLMPPPPPTTTTTTLEKGGE